TTNCSPRSLGASARTTRAGPVRRGLSTSRAACLACSKRPRPKAKPRRRANPTHERDHDAADRQEHDRADLDPVSPLGPTHAEPLARLSGDVGRISHAVEDVPNPDLVVRAELRSQLPDVRGDLVDHLAPRSGRKRGKLTLEVL